MADENNNGIPDSIERPTTASNSGDTGLRTKTQDGFVFQWVPAFDPITGDPLPGQGSWERVGAAPEGKGGSAGAEPRNDALTAAQAALSGYLQAQSLADARKLAAMENFQKLGQWAVPGGATQAPNFEPGGLANTAYAVAGMPKYTPPALQTAKVNPADVNGTIPPEIMQMIGGIKSAGGMK